jgi:hypothetical protein
MAKAAPTPEQLERTAFAHWKAELDFAQKDQRYKAWLQRSDKIIKRYRDERTTAEDARKRFNILWSNIQTLKPAVFSKMPTPIVERRFLDRDPAARLASEILERSLRFQMERSYYRQSIDKAVLDYLLPGLGQAWIRYQPSFEQVDDTGNQPDEAAAKPTGESIDGDDDVESSSYERLSYETICVDYVFFKDFLWGAARCWNDVPWVGRRSYLTKAELKEKFGDKAEKVTLDYTPDREGSKTDDKDLGITKKAEVWEIWSKANKKVIFIAPSTADLILKEEEDPLKLENFWPCPEPLFATQTNDTLVPVPDYVEYQDQARELDELTNRIDMITKAVKAAGVYDSSNKNLARLLQDGNDLKLIPVDQWAAFAEKGGMKGAVDLLPMQEIMMVLTSLYAARDQAKNILYEITGMSDIVRGASSGGAKTATEQRIKGQYASMRLQTRQDTVAFFCRSIISIMVDLMAEVFSPETFMQMTGYQQRINDAVQKAVAAVQPPPPPAEPQPSQDPAQAQIAQQQAAQQFQAAQQQAAQQATQTAMQDFGEAMKIIKSDKLRGFRIDIETDSTIQADVELDKGAAIELFSSTMQGLGAAGPIVEQAPELIKPIGDMIMFAYRRFRVGRTMEASLEEALDKIEERMKESAGKPQPPSPEEVKAKTDEQTAKLKIEGLQAQLAADKQRMDMEAARDQQKFDLDKQKADMDFANKQRDFQLKQQEYALREQDLALREREQAISAAAVVTNSIPQEITTYGA